MSQACWVISTVASPPQHCWWLKVGEEAEQVWGSSRAGVAVFKDPHHANVHIIDTVLHAEDVTPVVTWGRPLWRPHVSALTGEEVHSLWRESQ